MVWEWPQIVMAAMYFFNLVAAMWLNGMPKTGKHSAGVTAASTVIGLAVLYFGGFWTAVRP